MTKFQLPFGRKPAPQPEPAGKQQEGITPWFPSPSGKSNQPYTIWLTGTKDFTLHSVAQQAYGMASLWPKIADANPRIDPFHVPAGAHLVVPHHDFGEKPQQRPRDMKRTRQRW